MRRYRNSLTKIAALAIIAGGILAPTGASAHCDGLDGPVVKAAQTALQTGELAPVLIWVQPKDEAKIKRAFDETLAVRKLNPQAQAFADRYFFETLVRVHRAGENAPYTGLKPPGRDLGPAIPAADKALETGSDEALTQLLIDEVKAGLDKHFKEVTKKKGFEPNDVDAGREYVEAYVTYIHYVEGLYEAAANQPSGHYAESE
jgi:hypothetical protein